MMRVGIVGWGRWGLLLGRAIVANGSWDLRAIADLRDERRAEALQRHPHAAVHSTAEPIWSDEQLDAVVIATPAVTHFDLALAALQAGKHVLVEKPMTQTSAEARTLVDEAARRGLALMVDHTYLFSQPVQAIRALIVSGELASPLRYESSRLNVGTVRDDVSVLLDLGVHDLAVLDDIMPLPPVSIRARRAAPPSTGATHSAEMMVTYADGAEARVCVSWVAPAKTRRIAVSGSRASVLFDDVVSPHQIQVTGQAGDVYTRQCKKAEPLATLVEEFARAVDRRQVRVSDGQCGVRVMAQLEAAQRSLADDGAPVLLEAEVARR